MVSQRGKSRVAFVSENRSELAYLALLGVLNYREYAEHWRLLGPANSPFMVFEEMDLSAVDGVIGLIREPQHAEAILRAKVPTVNISTALEDVPLARISNDDEQIGQMGGEHLLERGFSNFAFVNLRDMWFGQRRLAGFRKAIEQGRNGDHRLFVYEAERFPFEAAATQWLSDLPKPVAVMGCNDQLACGMVEAAAALGLRVPDDVAVLGVDNDRWATRMAVTPMSSVNIDGEQIGYRAATLLEALMAGQATGPPQWIPPIGVATRRSTDIVVSNDPVAARALKYIHEHCSRGIGVDDVLDALGVSRRNLELHVKRATGLTPRKAICRAQVEQARKMLVTTDAPMYRIAEACGFSRQDRFSIVFRREAGMAPGEYRRRFGMISH